ncbi:AAA family ATPase [candidate division KSB1 bacterium]|nr:AAA family ATPase [candidate division KSB1 bacterium]
MTVEAIRLQNFMAFNDTDWLELKPISLLFGRNSSGKSAIIRALLLLKQSLNSSLETGPLTFVTKEGIDQGSFKESVHKKNEEEVENRSMIFCFRCSLEKEPILDHLRKRLKSDQIESWQPNIKLDNLKWIDISVGFTWNADKQTVDHTMIRLDLPFQKNQTKDQASPVIFAYEKLDYYTANELGEGEWFWSDILQVSKEYWPSLAIRASARGFWPTFANSETMASHALSSDSKFLTDLLQVAQTKVEIFLKSIKYIGPIRPQPERIFTIDRWTGLEWRQRGMGAFLDFLTNQVDADTLEKLDEWLRHLELGQEINVERARSISGFDALCQVMVHESLEAKFNIKDIGFGASQVLPVLLQSLSANLGSLVIIEQPELHLHPAAQAILADLFIDCANRRGVSFIVETHSEHLLLRLQRRISETSYDKIQPDKEMSVRNGGYSLESSTLSLVFVSRAHGDSRLEFIQVDKYGQLEKPSMAFQDFFRYDYDDVVHLTRTTADIMNLENKNEGGN